MICWTIYYLPRLENEMNTTTIYFKKWKDIPHDTQHVVDNKWTFIYPVPYSLTDDQLQAVDDILYNDHAIYDSVKDVLWEVITTIDILIPTRSLLSVLSNILEAVSKKTGLNVQLEPVEPPEKVLIVIPDNGHSDELGEGVSLYDFELDDTKWDVISDRIKYDNFSQDELRKLMYNFVHDRDLEEALRALQDLAIETVEDVENDLFESYHEFLIDEFRYMKDDEDEEEDDYEDDEDYNNIVH